MAEPRVILDAGHGGTDPGAVFQGRQEKDDNLRLALAVGEELQRRGIPVDYTRTEDVYQTPFEKASIANNSGADFFVSFHRNSSPEENQYSGVEVLVYDKTGKKLDMAENIVGAMGEVGFQEIGVKERPGLVVLRKTRMPALLVEAGFINSDEDNELFDAQFEQMVEKIADAIVGTLHEGTFETGQETDREENLAQERNYRVQTGAFENRENADRMLYELQNQGYPAFILEQDGYYRVQVGGYRDMENAIYMEQKLRRAGYSTVIVG